MASFSTPPADVRDIPQIPQNRLVHNPTEREFPVIWGGAVILTIGPGETITLSESLAQHAATHLANMMFNELGESKKPNYEDARKNVIARILIESVKSEDDE